MKEDKVFDIRKLERAAKRREWIQDKTDKIARWCINNKEILMVVVPVVSSVLLTGIKAVNKHRTARIAEHERDYNVYDARLGHYWELKRKPSSQEWVKIDYRMRNGDRLSDILTDMNILK